MPRARRPEAFMFPEVPMPRTYGTSAERGYGYQNRAKRREWKPKVGAGHVDCHAIVLAWSSRPVASTTQEMPPKSR